MYSHSRVFSVCLGVLVILGLLLWAPAAWSDWGLNDPHKMHYPQLPDLVTGIDVAATTKLADDFQCSATGPITDIHIWVSYFNDIVWPIPLRLEVWSNNPNPGNGFSSPLTFLWGRTFQPQDYIINPWATGLSEKYWNPIVPGEATDDHAVHQLNFFINQEPFVQTKGEIYWLVLSNPGNFYPPPGWKTSLDHFMDYAVFQNAAGEWESIYYNQQYRDLAFVITTPVPPSLLLLGSGLLGLGALGWRRRKEG